jgi:ketosteroid isomerase-like protein
MKRFLSIAALIVAAASSAVSQEGDFRPPRRTAPYPSRVRPVRPRPTSIVPNKDNVERVIRQIDNERVEAMLRSDIAVLDRICAADLIYTHSNGIVETKDQWIESIKSGAQRYKMFDRDDVQVRIYGDAAILTGRSKVSVTSKGQDKSFQLRFTAVYVKQQGRWQFVAWQSTRISD